MGEATQKERPVSLGNYLSYGIYRGLELALKPIPMPLVCVIGGMIGTLGGALFPGRKKIVVRNLRIAFGDQLSLEQIQQLARKTFWRSGANFIASLKGNTMQPEELNKCMDIVGIENLRDAREDGQGAILLLAHMGSWEILVQMHLIISGLTPFGGLYRPLGNPLLDRLVKRRRQKTGTKLFSRKDGFFTPIAHLKKAGVLGAFADQNASKHGMSVPFFGKLGSLTNLPALLHRRTGAPIIPISMETVAHGKWRVQIHPAVEISEAARTNATVTSSLCAEAFQRIMATSPADVLWMHGYWKVGTKRPLKIVGVHKQKNDGLLPAASKSFKVLLFTGQATADSAEITEQLARLRNYRRDLEIITVGEHAIDPSASQHIRLDPSEPPHIAANAIRRLDQTGNTPLDLALDVTPDAEGEEIIKLSGIKPAFALKGRHCAVTTKRMFETTSKRNLAGMLESLGLPAEEDV
ncbi:lysophospholipid acyltransferase family protein [Verrucomicrobiaceae bacterium 5K15]|uniref:Lysophospholipid acyltransferase family protein n=1 Tax=Oceaniferula flava TaxID=2800421 RepID=A0AAE2SBT7_9BACT|nr:lysophospholipid acyltransferase family protein [Oceaniferula flavus]MBK1853600.1 lysophospholipid acyltransferase family protein [Oceaniferula flavus]MBM1134905.1 lysophospholipid acyltransferase family protein [Oceaniferula flavus]